MTEEKEPLSFEQAVSMLPEGPRIHTFRCATFSLLGADWDRDMVLAEIKEHGAELAGPIAARMNHGLVVEFTCETCSKRRLCWNCFVARHSEPHGPESEDALELRECVIRRERAEKACDAAWENNRW